MKKTLIVITLFTIVGTLIATKDIDHPVKEVRAINVTQTQIGNSSDGEDYHCVAKIQITDKELKIGEKITADNQEDCTKTQ